MKIAVVGTGYVGLVVGACLAENGNEVICVDTDAAKVRGLQRGRIPIYEPQRLLAARPDYVLILPWNLRDEIVAQMSAVRSWGTGWSVAGFALTQQVMYENGKGYQAGDRYAGGFAVGKSLGSWRVRAGRMVQGETAELWNGIKHEEEGKGPKLAARLMEIASA